MYPRIKFGIANHQGRKSRLIVSNQRRFSEKIGAVIKSVRAKIESYMYKGINEYFCVTEG